MQKTIRIANSAIEEIVTTQLYCDTLDQYLYYLDHGATEVSRPETTFSELTSLEGYAQVH